MDEANLLRNLCLKRMNNSTTNTSTTITTNRSCQIQMLSMIVNTTYLGKDFYPSIAVPNNVLSNHSFFFFFIFTNNYILISSHKLEQQILIQKPMMIMMMVMNYLKQWKNYQSYLNHYVGVIHQMQELYVKYSDIFQPNFFPHKIY